MKKKIRPQSLSVPGPRAYTEPTTPKPLSNAKIAQLEGHLADLASMHGNEIAFKYYLALKKSDSLKEKRRIVADLAVEVSNQLRDLAADASVLFTEESSA